MTSTSEILTDCLIISNRDRISYNNKNELINNLHILQKRYSSMKTSIIDKNNQNHKLTSNLEKLQSENTQLLMSLNKSQNEKINIKEENTKLQNALILTNHENEKIKIKLSNADSKINELNNKSEFDNWLLDGEYKVRHELEKNNNKLQNDYIELEKINNKLQNDYIDRDTLSLLRSGVSGSLRFPDPPESQNNFVKNKKRKFEY
jgi:hypothetical protein